jgi:hypothetical protein
VLLGGSTVIVSTMSPVVLFVFNRLRHTQATIDALRANYNADKTDLYIFSDGWRTFADDPLRTSEDRRKVLAVREYVHSVKGFRRVVITERPANWGLARNVVGSVTEVITSRGRVVALEDDLVTAPNFLNFVNDALDTYQFDRRVWAVTGYLYPIVIPKSYRKDVFLAHRASSLGWGTWIDRWQKADWEISDFRAFVADRAAQMRFNRGGSLTTALISSVTKKGPHTWAAKWSYNQFKHHAYTVYPVRSLVKNIGDDRTGTNDRGMANRSVSTTALDDGSWSYEIPKRIRVNRRVSRVFREFFTGPTTLRWYVKQYLIRFGWYQGLYKWLAGRRLRILRSLLKNNR